MTLTKRESELLARLIAAIDADSWCDDDWWCVPISRIGNEPWIPGVLGSLQKKGLYSPEDRDGMASHELHGWVLDTQPTTKPEGGSSR